MRLWYTPNSPFARIARLALRDMGLAERVEERTARTRDAKSPFFEVTPLARVPLLETGAGFLSDTRDICLHFEALGRGALIFPPEGPEQVEMRHVATGLLEGFAVWLRENHRPEGERSDTVRAYEMARADHALPWLDARHERLGAGSFTALTLAATLDLAHARGLQDRWQHLAPGLWDWARQQARRPAMVETAPGPA